MFFLQLTSCQHDICMRKKEHGRGAGVGGWKITCEGQGLDRGGKNHNGICCYSHNKQRTVTNGNIISLSSSSVAHSGVFCFKQQRYLVSSANPLALLLYRRYSSNVTIASSIKATLTDYGRRKIVPTLIQQLRL